MSETGEIDVYRGICALESIADSLTRLCDVFNATPGTDVQVNRSWVGIFGGVDHGAGNDVCVETQVPVSPPAAPAKEQPLDDGRETLKAKLRALGIAFKDSARTGTLQQLLEKHNQSTQTSPCCTIPLNQKFAVNGITKVVYCSTCGRVQRLIENSVDVIPVPLAYYLAFTGEIRRVEDTLPVAPIPMPPVDLTPPLVVSPCLTDGTFVSTPASVPVAAVAPVSTPAPTVAPPIPQDGYVVTQEDVRMALIDLTKRKSREVALQILQQVTSKPKLSEADPALYPAIISACNQAVVSGDEF